MDFIISKSHYSFDRTAISHNVDVDVDTNVKLYSDNFCNSVIIYPQKIIGAVFKTSEDRAVRIGWPF